MAIIKREDYGSKGRFTIYENDKYAGEMTYTWAGESLFIIDHTGVDPEFGGKGYGKQMVMKAVDFAREQNVKILPLCPFARKVFDTVKEIEDVRHK